MKISIHPKRGTRHVSRDEWRRSLGLHHILPAFGAPPSYGGQNVQTISSPARYFLSTLSVLSLVTPRSYIHTDRQTNRQTDRQTDRQTNRQTDRQTDRYGFFSSFTIYYRNILNLHSLIYTIINISSRTPYTLFFQKYL